MGVLEEGQTLADGRWRHGVDESIEEHRDILADHKKILDEHAAKLALGNRRFASGEKRMQDIETKVDQNTDVTEKVKTDTSAIVAFTNNYLGFRAVVKGAVAFLVQFSVAAAALATVWHVLHSGHLPFMN